MIPVQNTVLSSTFDFWRNRTNEMADYVSTCVITTDANSSTVATPGNAAITGTFTANSFFAGNGSANLTANSTVLKISNSTVNTFISVPTVTQYNGNYFLGANGTWAAVPTYTGSTYANGVGVTATIDSFSMTTYNTGEYLLSVKDTTSGGNNYYSAKVLLTHDTATAYLTEYAQFITNTNIGVFTVGVTGSTLFLYFTPTIANTYVKFVRNVI